MNCKGLLTDRKMLVKEIELETGLDAVYCGAPGFRYTIGGHTVLRDGSLSTEDLELVKKLAEKGLIEGPETEETCISYSTEGFTGRNLLNLINIFAAREKMLNKAVDHPNAFHMGAGFVRELNEENPSTIGDFLDVVYTSGGEKVMKGVRVTQTTVSFPGFPESSTFISLADLILKAARNHGWIKPKAKEAENEKYSFRVWLNSIGMKGDQYREARQELLSHFEGDPSYRTEELKANWMERRKKATPEPDFIVL